LKLSARCSDVGWRIHTGLPYLLHVISEGQFILNAVPATTALLKLMKLPPPREHVTSWEAIFLNRVRLRLEVFDWSPCPCHIEYSNVSEDVLMQ
jgi:hypothetical protein